MKLNRDYEVNYLAGSSKDGDTIYIDKRLPEEMTLKSGKTVGTDEFIAIHEATEYIFERLFSYKYQYAHELATGLEREAVERANIPWKEYQNYMLGMVKKLRKIDAEEPPDLYIKPEVDTKDRAEIDVYEHWCKHDHS